MKTVKIPTEIFGEWAVTEVKLKTDLEFNATMNRIVEMAEEGLREVRNPSAAFLEERNSRTSGSSVAVRSFAVPPMLVKGSAEASNKALIRAA